MDESIYKIKGIRMTQCQLPFNYLRSNDVRKGEDSANKSVIEFEVAREKNLKERHNELVKRVVNKAIERVKWLDSQYDK